MIAVLVVTCLILVFWVTKLSVKLSEQQKISQYNLERFEKKFEDIDQLFDFEREQREITLERLRDLERKIP